MSLYSMVSRGMVGRLGHRATDGGATATSAVARTRSRGVKLPGGSMRVLEASLAAGAIATAILIGVGR